MADIKHQVSAFSDITDGMCGQLNARDEEVDGSDNDRDINRDISIVTEFPVVVIEL